MGQHVQVYIYFEFVSKANDTFSIANTYIVSFISYQQTMSNKSDSKFVMLISRHCVNSDLYISTRAHCGEHRHNPGLAHRSHCTVCTRVLYKLFKAYSGDWENNLMKNLLISCFNMLQHNVYSLNASLLYII